MLSPNAQDAFQTAGGGGQHQLGVDVELVGQLGLPLLGEVRRAQDGESLGVPGRAVPWRRGAASMVLPIPTSSAMRSRTGSRRSAMSSGTSW